MARRYRMHTLSCMAREAGIAVALLCALFATLPVQAQTFTVLHYFTKGPDGAYPLSVVIDRGGNLYGDATGGGQETYFCPEGGCGTIFKLSQKNGSWLLSTLYSFDGDPHGAGPGMLTMASDGSLYDSVFVVNRTPRIIRLQPPLQPCRAVQCYWTYTTIYSFTGAENGASPNQGPLTFDSAGNIYGVTESGGNSTCSGLNNSQCGTVYELVKTGNTYNLNFLYLFSGPDGANPGPYEGLLLDHFENIYGTTIYGGPTRNYGTVFQLQNTGSGWSENLLHAFSHDNDDQGRYPYAGLTMDSAGSLYGTTFIGGVNSGGTAFEFSYSGGWNFSVIYPFVEHDGDGGGSVGALTLGPDGSLYGATSTDGIYNLGTIFKLTYQNGSWNYQSLHDFRGGDNDGESPTGNLVFDAQGNLYGTTLGGGEYNGGTVWEITP
jgi:uncharacterized repeat protein (TIGR03803 family)